MGFKVPVGIREPFEQLPRGYILFNIEGGAEGDLAKDGDPPIFGIVMDHTAEGPNEVAGITREERFYLGIRDTDKRVQSGKLKADPMAENEETLMATMGRFKAYCAAAGVDIEGKDTEMIYSELKNRKVIGKVSYKASNRDPEKMFAQVDRWLPEGTVEPHLDEEPLPTAASGKSVAGAGPQPTRAVAPAPAPKAAAPAPGRPTPQRLGGRTATA